MTLQELNEELIVLANAFELSKDAKQKASIMVRVNEILNELYKLQQA